MAGLSCPARTLLTVPSTLIITNDFPPRIGGIESFVSEICTLLNHDVVVYASGSPGAAASDRDRGYPVIRDGPLLLPTPRVAARAVGLLRTSGATRVIFGAAAPSRSPGSVVAARRCQPDSWSHPRPRDLVGAAVPVARSMLRRIGDGCDHLTTISDLHRTPHCESSQPRRPPQTAAAISASRYRAVPTLRARRVSATAPAASRSPG